jgi:hypothetical protein
VKTGIHPRHKVYQLHIGAEDYYGEGEDGVLFATALRRATKRGYAMVKVFCADGLNPLQEKHPNVAVIFDVRSEDVVAVQTGHETALPK